MAQGFCLVKKHQQAKPLLATLVCHGIQANRVCHYLSPQQGNNRYETYTIKHASFCFKRMDKDSLETMETLDGSLGCKIQVKCINVSYVH